MASFNGNTHRWADCSSQVKKAIDKTVLPLNVQYVPINSVGMWNAADT